MEENIVFAIVFVLSILAAFHWLNGLTYNMERGMDERQQKKFHLAFQKAFILIAGLNCMVQVLADDILSRYMSLSFFALLNYLLMFVSLVINAIRFEAYSMELRRNRRGIYLLFLFGLVSSYAATRHLLIGDFTQGERLYLSMKNGAGSLLYSWGLLSVGSVGLYKIWQNHRYQDE